MSGQQMVGPTSEHVDDYAKDSMPKMDFDIELSFPMTLGKSGIGSGAIRQSAARMAREFTDVKDTLKIIKASVKRLADRAMADGADMAMALIKQMVFTPRDSHTIRWMRNQKHAPYSRADHEGRLQVEQSDVIHDQPHDDGKYEFPILMDNLEVRSSDDGTMHGVGFKDAEGMRLWNYVIYGTDSMVARRQKMIDVEGALRRNLKENFEKRYAAYLRRFKSRRG